MWSTPRAKSEIICLDRLRCQVNSRNTQHPIFLFFFLDFLISLSPHSQLTPINFLDILFHRCRRRWYREMPRRCSPRIDVGSFASLKLLFAQIPVLVTFCKVAPLVFYTCSHMKSQTYFAARNFTWCFHRYKTSVFCWFVTSPWYGVSGPREFEPYCIDTWMLFWVHCTSIRTWYRVL